MFSTFITGKSNLLSMDVAHNTLFDDNLLTGVVLSCLEITPVMASFATNTFVHEVVIHANEALVSAVIDRRISFNVEAMPPVNLDDFEGGISSSDITGKRCIMIDPQGLSSSSAANYMFKFDCNGHEAVAISVDHTVGDISGKFRIYEIEIIGEENEMSEHFRMTNKYDFATLEGVTTQISEQATNEPPPPNPNHDDVLQNTIPAIIEESSSDNYKVVWRPHFGTPIPYKRLMAAVSSNSDADETYAGNSLISFLTERGYLDYILDKEATSFESRGRLRDEVASNNLVDSIKLLQQFNGFPETGEASKDIFGFVQKPRCGVSDVEFHEEEEDDKLCFTLYRDGKINDPSVSS